MTVDVSVLVPVLNRPARALPLAESLISSVGDSTLELVFVMTSGDVEQRVACEAACMHVNTQGGDNIGALIITVPWPVIRGDYARKINYALWRTRSPYVLCGADDVRFGPGWADIAVDVARTSGMCFVATNDNANPKVKAGEHATHPLVCRDYVLECGTIDTPGLVYHEGYWHQFVDNEATETAQWRDCFVAAPDSVVQHMHPIFQLAGERRVALDDTYLLGQAHTAEDRALWRTRKRLLT